MSANSARPDATTARLSDKQQNGAHALDARPKTTTLALQTTSHVVGYMGDGINDALALPAADAGSAVDTAVDVAKKPFYARLEHAQRSWRGWRERSARRATTLVWQTQLPPISARWRG